MEFNVRLRLTGLDETYTLYLMLSELDFFTQTYVGFTDFFQTWYNDRH